MIMKPLNFLLMKYICRFVHLTAIHNIHIKYEQNLPLRQKAQIRESCLFWCMVEAEPFFSDTVMWFSQLRNLKAA